MPGTPRTASRTERSAAVVRELAERVVTLAEGAPDLSVKVPFTPAWTVAQVTAHLAGMAARYSPADVEPSRFAGAAEEVAAMNDAQIATLSGADLPRIVAALRAAVATLPSGPAVDGAPGFPYTGGVTVTPADLLGILLGEFLVHGYDLARVLRRPWPIATEHAVEVVESLQPILPAWVDADRARGATATIELRLRGAGRHVWEFTDGRLTVDPPSPRAVDVTISADPRTQLLLGYRRVPLWRAILSGGTRASGRRPMVAFRAPGWFRAP